jgi:hypothetical protein
MKTDKKSFINQMNRLLGICAVSGMVLLSSCGGDSEGGNITEDGNYGYGADVEDSRQSLEGDTINASNQDSLQLNDTPDVVNPNSGAGSVPINDDGTIIENDNTGGGRGSDNN